MSRIITGIVLIILGLLLFQWSLFEIGEKWIFLIYGLVVFILGIFIIFNKKEDQIEEIKNKNKN